MDITLLAQFLKKVDLENAVETVTSIEQAPILEYKQYGLTIYRLVVNVVLGNGKTAKKRIILKEPIKDGNEKNLRLLLTETKVYCSVLKEMEYIMEVDEDINIFWCKLLYRENDKTLMFEDLEAKGFKHKNWNTFLDMDHSTLVLRNLGRFHGMCKVLEERGFIIKGEYDSSPRFLSDKEFISNFFTNGIKILRRGIFKYWGMSWDSVAEKLTIPPGLLEKKLAEIGELKETRFNVLNHGDCWINNVMFQYDMNNKPNTMRFLNFQRPFYNSPCLDITYFMFTSIDPRVRRNNFDQLLKAYYESLLSTLSKFEFSGTKPTYKEISVDMDRVSLFGLSVFAVEYAVLAADKTNDSDLEHMYEASGNGVSFEIYKKTSLAEKMISDLVALVHVLGL